jgi:purine nucleoside permease
MNALHALVEVFARFAADEDSANTVSEADTLRAWQYGLAVVQAAADEVGDQSLLDTYTRVWRMPECTSGEEPL